MTSIYFCKLCDFECGRNRDIENHLIYAHGSELIGIFEVNDDEFVVIPKNRELLAE
jgi:hypothetical protein